MTDIPDRELLAEFARNESEAAFAELVRRHIALVHSVAWRHTDNPQSAQEITQAVFIILARKAAALGRDTVLSGWLHHTARLTAANFRRAEFRRIRREQEAFMQSTIEEAAPDIAWAQLAPMLDEAVAHLGATDRAAVVLRHFENKSLAEVGAALGTSEDAAKKRVARTVEKLRKFFTRRGVALSAAAIAGVVSANSVQAAPAALAAKVSVIAAKGMTTTSLAALVKGTMKTMAWTKAKSAIVSAVILMLAVGTTAFVVSELKPRPFVFTAEGWYSYEGHRKVFDTNEIFLEDGKVAFAYSNGIWWVQYQIQHLSSPYLPTNLDEIVTAYDEKRIPDGIREILTVPAATIAPKPGTPPIRPYASVRTNVFPNPGRRGLFLPWLSLCPKPELPFVDSRFISYPFPYSPLDRFTNKCPFKAFYLNSRNHFLSELIITNNGSFVTSDGNVFEYPEPYNQGFVELSYKVVETTNYSGISFPLNAVLYGYTPILNGKSPEELETNIICKLHIQKTDIGGNHLKLIPVPASLVALDYRFRLPNGSSVNYESINDEWYSITNERMLQLAKMVRQARPKISVPKK